MQQGEQKNLRCPTAQQCMSQKKLNKQQLSDQDQKLLYLKIMEKIECENKDSYIIKRLAMNKIKYTEDTSFDYEFHIQILRATYNFQALLLKISYFRFETQISLLNIPGNLQFDGTLLGSGTYGDVYAYQKNNYQTIAIKVIKSGKFHLHKIIKQYFLNLIMSALECGPKISKYLGFDILLFEQSGLFSMELCSQINKFSEDDIKYLLQKLKLIHSLNIIHGDIKPANIVYSKFFKRPVFCDFGLTRQIPEKNCQKSATCFFGSYSYVSPSMFRLLANNLYGDVNLYYNDLYALQRTLKEICYNRIKQHKQNMFAGSKIFDYCLEVYLVFMKQYNLIDEVTNQRQFLNFIILTKPSQQLYTFLLRNFGYKENYQTQSSELTIVREIYTERGVSIKKWQQLKSKSKKNFEHRLLNIKNPYKVSKNQLKIQAIENIFEDPDLKFNEICQYTVEYLALWRDESWKNAEKTIEKLFPKYLIKQDVIINLSTIQKKQITIENYKQVSIETKLLLILTFLLRKYTSQYNLVYVSKLCDFLFNFFPLEEHLEVQFFVVQLIIESRKFDQEVIANQTVNFMILGNTPISFDYILKKFLLWLQIIKNLLSQSLLRKYCQIYEVVLKDVCKFQAIKTDLNVPSPSKSSNNKLMKLLEVSKLCLHAKIELLNNRYKQTISLLQAIESQLDQIHYDCSKFIKKFVIYGFIVAYTNLKNYRGQMLAIQQIKSPKAFQKLWNSSNQQILIYRYSIAHKWSLFCQEMSKYLHSKKYCCLSKMRVCVKFSIQIGMFFYEFYEVLIVILDECFKKIKSWSDQEIVKDITFSLFTILELLILYHKISEKNKIIAQKKIKQLDEMFYNWCHFGVQLKRQIGIFIGLKILFLVQQKKFVEAIEYYKQHKHIKMEHKQQVHCLFYIGLCHAQLRLSETVTFILQCYSILRTKDEHFLLSSSPYFIYVLQSVFYQQKMLEEQIQLFDIILQQIYLNQYVSKQILKYFVKQCIAYFPKYANAILDHFLKKEYYIKKQIQYHNCSVLLIQAMYNLNYRQNQRYFLLGKIAITLDSLQAKIRLMIKPKYYKLMILFAEKRKKVWMLHKIQTIKQEVMKKKILIKKIKKYR